MIKEFYVANAALYHSAFVQSITSDFYIKIKLNEHAEKNESGIIKLSWNKNNLLRIIKYIFQASALKFLLISDFHSTSASRPPVGKFRRFFIFGVWEISANLFFFLIETLMFIFEHFFLFFFFHSFFYHLFCLHVFRGFPHRRKKTLMWLCPSVCPFLARDTRFT